MSVRVLLGFPAAAAAERVAAPLQEADHEIAGRSATARDVVSRVLADDVDVAVLDERLGPLPIMELARELSRNAPDVGLVLLTDESTPELLNQSLRAGFRAVVERPVSVESLHEAVSAAAEWAGSVRRRLDAGVDELGSLTRGGRMLLLAGGKGGVGVTLAAVQLALRAAASAPDRSVCLVDLDLQSGDVATLMDVRHNRSILDLLGVGGELGSRQLDEALFRHETGLRVLLAPPRGEDGEDVDGAAARRILGALRSRFDLVVVDGGTTVTEASAAAAELCDQLVVLATTDVPALRGANRLLGLWERIGVEPASARVLLNRVHRQREVQPELAARVSKAQVLGATVPAGFRDVEDAVNTGDPARLDGQVGRAFSQVLGELDVWPTAHEPTGDEPAPTLQERITAESGQVVVETAAMLPLLLVVLVLLWQIVLIGVTFVFAEHAAREGARAAAVEGSPPVQQVVAAEVPGAWRDGLSASVGSEQVEVTIAVPLLFPGVTADWDIAASSGIVREPPPLGLGPTRTTAPS